MKKCIYCRCEISEGSVVDICEKCMFQVWGPKMAQTIVASMEKEKEKGNMELGRVSDTTDIKRGNERRSSASGFSSDNFSRSNFNEPDLSDDFIELEEDKDFISR